MSIDNIMPIRSDSAKPRQPEISDKPMPSREVLEKRLSTEEERLCSAYNVINVVIELLNVRDEGDDHMLWSTLRVAKELLGETLSGNSPSYLLRTDRVD